MRPGIVVLGRLVATAAVAGCFSRPPFSGIDAGGNDGDGDAMIDAAPIIANRVFVTSTTTSVATMGGMSGADTICNTRAAAAELSGTYVAWLSNSTIIGRGRLTGAQGWIRTDGKPFAATVERMLMGHVWHPIRFDESANDAGEVRVLTATTAAGTGSDDCNGLIGGTAEGIRVGISDATKGNWTDNAEVRACTVEAHLYCFQIDLDRPVELVPAAGRRAFVSSPWSPNGGGIEDADMHCMNDAETATLGGTYKALLSTTDIAASVRFNATWVRRDGVPLAATAQLVLAGLIDAPLNVDVNGDYLDDVVAWTGVAGASSTPATLGTMTCSNWTVTSGMGGVGRQVKTTASWFAYANFTCGLARPLYCLEL